MLLYNVTHIYDSNNSGPNGIEMQPLLLDYLHLILYPCNNHKWKEQTGIFGHLRKPDSRLTALAP